MNEILLGLKEDWDIVGPVLFLLIPATFYILGLMEGKKGHFFVFLGLIAHLWSIVYRGYSIGTIPLTEKHDNISFMAFVMAVAYLYFHVKQKVEGLPVVALPAVCLFLFVSVMHRTINTVSPFMHSPWFYLHTFFYFSGYGLFILSGCVGVVYLFKRRGEDEEFQYRLAMTGWIVFTIGLFAGSIWFFFAYGMYWLWSSKELWTTIVWFFYGVYLHARYIRSLRGLPAALMGVLGVFVVLFAYFGIGPGKIIQSPPTQF